MSLEYGSLKSYFKENKHVTGHPALLSYMWVQHYAQSS